MNKKIYSLTLLALCASCSIPAFASSAARIITPEINLTAAYQDGLVCPVMENAVTADSQTIEFKGLFVRFCCPACDTKFLAGPEVYFEKAIKNGTAIAESMFDPVSKIRIEAGTNTPSAVFGGVRFNFSSVENREEFLSFPGTYAAIPEKESLKCPIMGNTLESQSLAAGYADYKGVRYYFCCDGCDKKFAEDPEKAAATVSGSVRNASTGQPAKKAQTLAPT